MTKLTKRWLYGWIKNKNLYILGMIFWPAVALIYTVLAIFIEQSFSWFQALFLGVSVLMNMFFLSALRAYYKSSKS